jgi:hypothetical protein
MRTLSLWTVAVLGAVVALGVCLQVYLIAAYIYGAGSGALDAHEAVGASVYGLQVIVFLAALVAWWGRRREVVLAVALLLVGTVQYGLASGDEWVGALHGLLALAVLGLAGLIHVTALREVRAGDRPAGSTTA